jgi:isopentenyl-diphosphate Delta-isomerase
VKLSGKEKKIKLIIRNIIKQRSFILIMDDEFAIEVDKQNRRIGLRPMKDFQNGSKRIHRSAHLLLFNSLGQVLIHKRSANKTWYPNLYNYSVSGAVSNESFLSCIKHEMREELGISIPVKKLFVYPFFDKFDNAFHALFIGKSDKSLSPDKREISELKWFALDDLKKDLKENPSKYVPHVVFGLKKYFSLKK